MQEGRLFWLGRGRPGQRGRYVAVVEQGFEEGLADLLEVMLDNNQGRVDMLRVWGHHPAGRACEGMGAKDWNGKCVRAIQSTCLIR